MDDDATRARLLAAVLAAPDDVAPRLIYADWLHERGDARGEFITVQCELDALGEDGPGPRRAALMNRSSALLAKHRSRWLGPVFGKRAKDCTLSRGFVSHVTMRAAEAAERFEPIVRHEPVRCVHVTDKDLGVLVASPAAPRLRALDLRNVQLGARWARPLFEASTFTALEELDVVLCHLGATGAEATHAMHPARFPSLRSLHLANNGLRDAGARALASSPILASLRFLHLGMNHIGPEGAAALAASPFLERIETIAMWQNPLGQRGLAVLRERFGDRVVADEP